MVLASGAAEVAAERLEPFSVDPGLLGGPQPRTQPAPEAAQPPAPSRPVKPAKPAAAPAESRAPQAGAVSPSANASEAKTAEVPASAVTTVDASTEAIAPAGSDDGTATPAAPGKPRKARAKIAENSSEGAAPLYDDPDYEPMQHTPASLREWSGASHDGPVLRRITPNARGLPVEGTAPRRGATDKAGVSGSAGKAAPPASPSTGNRSMGPASVPPARTSLRGMDAFEVDPALLGGPAPRQAPHAAPSAMPTLQRAEAAPGPTAAPESRGSPQTAQVLPSRPATPAARPTARLEPFIVDPALMGQAPVSAPPASVATESRPAATTGPSRDGASTTATNALPGVAGGTLVA